MNRDCAPKHRSSPFVCFFAWYINFFPKNKYMAYSGERCAKFSKCLLPVMECILDIVPAAKLIFSIAKLSFSYFHL